MCGRFVQKSLIPDILDEFDLEEAKIEFDPSFNVAPSQSVLAIIDTGKRQLVRFQWGLIPSWAKDPAIGNQMINARSETLAEKPSFKTAFKKRRCLIIADGFFEWRKSGNAKTPVYIRLKSHRPFGMAGLYEHWKAPAGEQIDSCTIITTQANALIRNFHERMPVIIPKEKIAIWLNPTLEDPDQLKPLLEPYPATEMEAYDVSRMVNSPKNNGAELINPA